MKLEVWDSPNSAGVVIDAVRCAKLAKDAGIAGSLLGPSAYFMKSPPVQYTDEQARLMVEQFIAEYGQSAQSAASAAKAPQGSQATKATKTTQANGHAEKEPTAVHDLPSVSAE